jgi:hypothetical protein
VYLKHLINNRGLTVYDPASDAVVFWADEVIVREKIREGKIRAVGNRKCIQRLEWIGPQLSTARIIKKEFSSYSPSPARGPKKYSHNQERTSTDQRYVAPFDENIDGVWTMVRLPNSTQIVFLAVAAQCGARIFRRRTNLGMKPSSEIASFARNPR